MHVSIMYVPGIDRTNGHDEIHLTSVRAVALNFIETGNIRQTPAKVVSLSLLML